jgi:exodeoxyribonuclease V alpha subunit
MTVEVPERRLALRAHGVLAAFNRAGVLDAADVHVADRLGVLAGEAAEDVLLAVALAVRAARLGAVCVDLATIADQPMEVEGALSWPAVGPWVAQVAASPFVARGVVRVAGTLLYLDRHWREEEQVHRDLVARLDLVPPPVDEALLAAGTGRLFPGGWEEQRDASEGAARQWTTVLTGGPGTGKTASVARLLVLVSEQFEAEHGRRPRIALAAPTGKASTRLQESVERERRALAPDDRARLDGLEASTLHRLLGWRPDSSTRFRHHRENRLPHDVIVVDEVSMVALAMMARLLEAVRPSTRLVLVGDPDQLASVEAGNVLADLVTGLASLPTTPVFRLETTHRTQGSAGAELDDLAAAIRAERPDDVVRLLWSGSDAVRLVDPEDEAAVRGVEDDIVAAARRVTAAAETYGQGDGLASGVLITELLDEHRLLCAHRTGPYGVAGWNRHVQRLLAERTGVTHYEEWYAGRPVLITTNDRGLRLSNGDLGVTVRLPDGRLRVLVRLGEAAVPFAPTRLSGVETVYAMTVHKSQGSEARAVTVVLPPEDSPLLTRELFYTAVTRARERLTVVGTESALRAALARKVQRASGLALRFAGTLPAPVGS